MPTILRWQNTDPDTKERFITELMSMLSTKWYPRNIIGGNLYDILEMYACEYATGAVELLQMQNDLNVDYVREVPVDRSGVSKAYDNFGVLVGMSKLPGQNFNTYNNTNIWQSYRNTLAFLIQAQLNGSTDLGVSTVGAAMTGVHPIMITPLTESYGWRLTTYSGSITAIGPTILVVDPPFGRYGKVFYVDDEALFQVGGTATLSYSKLNRNTILKGEEWFYDGTELHVFAKSESVTSDVMGMIDLAIHRVLPSYIKPRIFYHPDFVYTRFAAGNGYDLGYNSAREYVYNTRETSATGAILDSSILELPVTFCDRDWWYDWLTVELNNGRVQVELRQCASASIPAITPYYKYDENQIYPLPQDNATGHWLFDSGTGDIIPNVVTGTLSYNALIADPSQLVYVVPSRVQEETRGGRSAFQAADNGFMLSVAASGSIQRGLDFKDAFNWEIWMSGVASTNTSSTTLVIKRTGPDRSWNIVWDWGNKELTFAVASGAVISDVTGDISQHINTEIGEYWHRWAGCFLPGEAMLLYEDDHLLASQVTNLVLPQTSDAANMGAFTITGGRGLSIDEFMCSTGSLSPQMNYDRWDLTRPHVFRPTVQKGHVQRYQQARFRVFAECPKEVQIHQFSMRGA